MWPKRKKSWLGNDANWCDELDNSWTEDRGSSKCPEGWWSCPSDRQRLSQCRVNAGIELALWDRLAVVLCHKACRIRPDWPGVSPGHGAMCEVLPWSRYKYYGHWSDHDHHKNWPKVPQQQGWSHLEGLSLHGHSQGVGHLSAQTFDFFEPFILVNANLLCFFHYTTLLEVMNTIAHICHAVATSHVSSCVWNHSINKE